MDGCKDGFHYIASTESTEKSKWVGFAAKFAYMDWGVWYVLIL